MNNKIWSTTGSSNMQIYNLEKLDMKVASILAQLYLSEQNNTSAYYFYNQDFYLIPNVKVLRIRIDIVDQSKLFKKKK
jgi:hypothetical protein